MQICRISIHNFRSISNVSFDLCNYSILMGKNNSGKTNIIDAIQCFFDSKYKFSYERDFPKFQVEDDESWVEITYHLDDTEIDKIAEKYNSESNLVTLKQFFKVTEGSDWKVNKIYAYEGDTLSTDEFYGFVQKSKIGKIIYIPAVSKLSDNLKLSGPSPLRDLMNQVVRPIIANSSHFSEFSESFKNLRNNICKVENENGKSLSGFEEDINQEISSWNVELGIDFMAPTEDEIIKQSIRFTTTDKGIGTQIDPENYGSGFQRHLIYSLIKLSSDYFQKTERNSEHYDPELVVLIFEEPEAFLHPTQQLLLADSLRLFSNEENQNTQVLISTHSPHFVSYNMDDLKSIIHVDKRHQETSIGQLTIESIRKIQSDNQEINDIVKGTQFEVDNEGLQAEMENIKYALWLDPDRCGMFFADHVLLVEGKSEYALLNYLDKKGRINHSTKAFFYVDCLGKFNIHRYINLLGDLKIDHSIILDKDNAKDFHPQILELIRNSRNIYTQKIICFKDTLEGYLAISHASRSSRKPQHIMYELTVLGHGSEPQIQKLCDILNNLDNIDMENEIELE